eukprot:TRINITY_DN9229_c0_g1_i1.p1 TRINITY_DN9229_c0_g1~~TRINITY_DN9229_c0_g1_i1.p1  ORF type:complete len:190 (+),score=34.28 TRINITY_DN9229_c0_g1_i1:248-817(+)
MADNSAKKFLEVRVEEASGLNRVEEMMWDKDITEAFVKAEVRGGAKGTQKAATKPAKVENCKMTWREPLYLEISDGNQFASELRLLLCREKTNNGKRSVSVITACGIFVKDIVQAVPIDKYFELFKPGTGEEGGYIRLRMNLVSEDEIKRQRSKDKPKQGPLGLIAKLVLAGAVAAAAVVATKKKMDQK